MSLRPLLNDPAARLALDTAAAMLALPAGLEVIAHAGGSTWAPLIGGPVATLAGARLIFLARLWYGQIRPDKGSPAKPPAQPARALTDAHPGSGT